MDTRGYRGGRGGRGGGRFGNFGDRGGGGGGGGGGGRPTIIFSRGGGGRGRVARLSSLTFSSSLSPPQRLQQQKRQARFLENRGLDERMDALIPRQGLISSSRRKLLLNLMSGENGAPARGNYRGARAAFRGGGGGFRARGYQGAVIGGFRGRGGPGGGFRGRGGPAGGFRGRGGPGGGFRGRGGPGGGFRGRGGREQRGGFRGGFEDGSEAESFRDRREKAQEAAYLAQARALIRAQREERQRMEEEEEPVQAQEAQEEEEETSYRPRAYRGRGGFRGRGGYRGGPRENYRGRRQGHVLRV